MTSIRLNKQIKFLISLTFWLLLWQLLSVMIGKELILPSPFSVIESLGRLLQTSAFWLSTLATLVRILTGYLSGVVLGVMLAVATSFNSWLDAVFSSMIKTVRATPVASFIILALLWMSKSAVPGLIAMLMAVPIVWENLCSEFRAVDRDLLEMASAYRLSKWKVFMNIYVPSSLPGFSAACVTAMGLAWKSGIAAEVLAQPQLAIGTNLYYSKIYLETSELFAWTATVIALSWIIEKFVRWLIERGLNYENN